ncbi:MAG: MFS transporter, partial [Gammaproteobacteria bacterium]
MNSLKPESGRHWGAALRVYLHPRVLAMLFLGFSAGLPFMLVAGTLTAWLTVDGVGMAEIGMFAWVGIMYSVKFVWAPVIDRMRLPLLARWLGRRRSWMLVAQIGVGLALMGLAYSEPTTDLGRFAWLAVLVSFASATQDIVIDAYRIEAVEMKVQGAMAASYQLGYRIALLIAGAGVLYMAQFASWQIAYQTMALLMSVGIITVLLIDEPESSDGGTPLKQSQPLFVWFAEAVIGPFAEFFSRNGRWAFVLLAFIGLYRVSDMVLGVMANP